MKVTRRKMTGGIAVREFLAEGKAEIRIELSDGSIFHLREDYVGTPENSLVVRGQGGGMNGLHVIPRVANVVLIRIGKIV